MFLDIHKHTHTPHTHHVWCINSVKWGQIHHFESVGDISLKWQIPFCKTKHPIHTQIDLFQPLSKPPWASACAESYVCGADATDDEQAARKPKMETSTFTISDWPPLLKHLTEAHTRRNHPSLHWHVLISPPPASSPGSLSNPTPQPQPPSVRSLSFFLLIESNKHFLLPAANSLGILSVRAFLACSSNASKLTQ